MNFLNQINRNKFIYAILFSAFFVFTSCEQESMEGEIVNLEKMLLLTEADCAIDCLDPEGPYVAGSDITNQLWGGGKQEKIVSYTVYNTPTHFIVEVYYERNNGNTSDLLRATVFNEVQEAFTVESGSTTVFEFDLQNNWEACDVVDFDIRQEGQGSPIDLSGDYSLFSFCGCTEDFYYEENEDGSYTFTYTADENLENAEVKFTTPHISGFEALDGKTYIANPGQGNGANNVLTWTGDIDMCEAISFTLLFEADCSQNNAGFANVFTDISVNGVSKKGETGNIRVDCD